MADCQRALKAAFESSPKIGAATASHEVPIKILVLEGDGIGPEITAATLAVLAAASDEYQLNLTFETMEIGFASLKSEGSTCPAAVLARVPEVDGVILGPVSHSDYPARENGGINPSAALRVNFELGGNIRPARSRDGLTHLRSPMDLIIVREATEGFYADRNMAVGNGEFMPDPDMALAVRKVTSKATRRVAHIAFALARERRNKVTAVHKANVLKLSDGLFLREVRAVAADYPDVELDEALVDAAAALLIRTPGRFDVIVTTNMFGDILSDEAAELCGGLGLAGSINVSDSICVAQAQHGSAPDIEGLGIANPTSLILSGAMLLNWRGRRDSNDTLIKAGRSIEHAIDEVLSNPELRTRDLGGSLTTSAFTSTVVDTLRAAA